MVERAFTLERRELRDLELSSYTPEMVSFVHRDLAFFKSGREFAAFLWKGFNLANIDSASHFLTRRDSLSDWRARYQQGLQGSRLNTLGFAR